LKSVRGGVEPMVGDELIEPAAERRITAEKSVVEVKQTQPLHPDTVLSQFRAV
jgi:hypothetical protein